MRKTILTTIAQNVNSLQHWFGVDSRWEGASLAGSRWGADLTGGGRVRGIYRRQSVRTMLGLLAGYYEGWWDRFYYAHLRCVFVPALPRHFAGGTCRWRRGVRQRPLPCNVIVCGGDFLYSGVCSSGARKYHGLKTAGVY